MSVFKTLANGIADLSSLEVITLTGSIVASINSVTTEAEDAPTKNNIINWKKLMEEAASANAQVSIVAATKVEFDGDTTQFFAAGAPKELLDAQAEAVANANEVREGLVRMFSGLLGIK